MMAAYRQRSFSWIHGKSLSKLTDFISIYTREECRVPCGYASHLQDTYHRDESRCRCYHSSPINISSLLARNNNISRRVGGTNIQYMRQISSDGARRKLLKGGRARRKMQSKHATHKTTAIKPEKRIRSTTLSPDEALDDSTSENSNDHQEETSNSAKDILFGNPIRDRYIRNQQKINYPKTWSGWKEIFRRTKDTYLMTFEGFLLPKKERDEHGNIIPDDKVNEDEDDADEETTMKEKATDVANQMAGNLQKNMSTIKEEAPKLLKMGQEATGISSREELRAWVGEQLKLATACLTEFMKGYRSGRDDEVDKMLHEYFKDLDQEKNDTATSAVDMAQTESEDTDTKSPKQRRLWGRKERRRAKAMKSIVGTTSLGTNA